MLNCNQSTVSLLVFIGGSQSLRSSFQATFGLLGLSLMMKEGKHTSARAKCKRGFA